MSLDPIQKLAKTLASTANEQDSIKQNLSPDDTNALLQVQFSESVTAGGTLGLTAIKHVYLSTSFIIDHPTQGVLDSSTLLLDGGYAPNAEDFPLTFPLTFGEGETLFTIDI